MLTQWSGILHMPWSSPTASFVCSVGSVEMYAVLPLMFRKGAEAKKLCYRN